MKQQIQEMENIDSIGMVRESGLTPEDLAGLLAKIQESAQANEIKEKEESSSEA